MNLFSGKGSNPNCAAVDAMGALLDSDGLGVLSMEEKQEIRRINELNDQLKQPEVIEAWEARRLRRQADAEAYPNDPYGYAERVRELEAEGLTTSDAQSEADVEFAEQAAERAALEMDQPKPLMAAYDFDQLFNDPDQIVARDWEAASLVPGEAFLHLGEQLIAEEWSADANGDEFLLARNKQGLRRDIALETEVTKILSGEAADKARLRAANALAASLPALTDDQLSWVGGPVTITPRVGAGMSRDTEPGLQPWNALLVGYVRDKAIIKDAADKEMRLIDRDSVSKPRPGNSMSQIDASLPEADFLAQIGSTVTITPRVGAGMSRDTEPGLQPWKALLVGYEEGKAVIEHKPGAELRSVDTELVRLF